MNKTYNILTIHKEPNYGALLQAYALYKILESFGVKPKIINLSLRYRNKPFTFFHRLLVWAYNKYKGYDYCNKQAEIFFKKYAANRTKPFYTLAQLMKHKWNPDESYILGSDQVWNPCITGNLSKAFTFDFLPRNCSKVYTYASSFGYITDEQERFRKLDISSFSSKFRLISVRESFGVDYLAKYNCQAIETIDPTLLIDSYQHLLPREPENLEIILQLALGESDSMNLVTTKLSKRLRLPIEKYYGYLQTSRKINKCFLSVNDWLYKIASSRLIITDSFHAIVFCILFHKDFYYYSSHPSKNLRIENLLSHLGIQGRIISDVDSMNCCSSIDYKQVKIKLEKLRESSLEYIKSILKQ